MAREPETGVGAESLIARFMSEGERLFQAGEFEEALSRWLKVLEIDPANELAMQNMARAHEKLMGSAFKKVVSKPLDESENEPAPPPPARPSAPTPPPAPPRASAAAPPRPAVAPAQPPAPPPPVGGGIPEGADVTRKLTAPSEVARKAEAGRPAPVPKAATASGPTPVPAASATPRPVPAPPPPPAAAPPAPVPPPPRAPSEERPRDTPTPQPRPAASPRDSDQIERRDDAAESGDRSLDTHLKRYLKRGVDFFNSKDYDKAIIEWAKVLRERPLHEPTLEYIRKSRTKLGKTITAEKAKEDREAFDRLVKHGDEYFGENEHRMAINQYVQALTYGPDDKSLLDKVRRAEGALRQAGESVSVAPGTPRTLRHSESPLATSSSGAFQRPASVVKDKEQKEQSERLAAAAQSIYNQILKDESDGSGGISTPKKAGRPSGVRTQAVVAAPKASGTKRLIQVGIILVGLGFIGWQVYSAYIKPKRDLLEQARRYRDARLYKEASEILTRYLAQGPETVEAVEMRADSLFQIQDYEGAMRDYKRLVELQPDEIAHKLKQGEVAMKAEDFATAAQMLEAVIGSADPAKQTELLDQLITCYINTGNIAKAISTAEQLYEKDPKIEILQIKGELLLSMNRFEEARKTLEEVRQKGSKDPSLLFKIVSSYRIEGDLEGARRTLESVVEEIPDLTFMLARISYLQGDVEGALQLINRGLTADPHHWRGYAELAYIWMSEYAKDPTEDHAKRIEQAFLKAKEQARIDGRLSFVEGVALVTLGRTSEADNRLEEAVRHIEPAQQDDLGFSYQAMAQLQRKDYPGALEALQRAMTTEPDSIAHWVLKGYVLQESGDAAGAAEAFLKSFQVQPGEKKVLVPVQSLMRSKEDLDAKIRLAAMKLDPEKAQALQKFLDSAK